MGVRKSSRWIDRARPYAEQRRAVRPGDLVLCDFFQDGKITVHFVDSIQPGQVCASGYMWTVLPWFDPATHAAEPVTAQVDPGWFIPLSCADLDALAEFEFLDPARLLDEDAVEK